MNEKLRDFIKYFLRSYAFMIGFYPIATLVRFFYVAFILDPPFLDFIDLAFKTLIHWFFACIAGIVAYLIINVVDSPGIVEPGGKIRSLALLAVVPIGGAIGTVLIANDLIYDINSGSPSVTFDGILMAMFVVYPITALIAAGASNID